MVMIPGGWCVNDLEASEVTTGNVCIIIIDIIKWCRRVARPAMATTASELG